MHSNLDLQLELTDFCSLRCVFCNGAGLPPHPHRQKFLSLQLLEKLLSELNCFRKKYKRISIQINWAGESVLHPQFLEIIELLYQAEIFDRIELHTNGLNWNKKDIILFLSLINQKKWKKIPFFQITFSVDAFSWKTYQLLRRGGDFKKSLFNFLFFRFYRDNLEYVWPRIVWQFIVRKENRTELLKNIRKLQKKIQVEKIVCLPYQRPQETYIMEDVIYLSPCFPLTEENYQVFKRVVSGLNLITNEKDLPDNIENQFKKGQWEYLCYHPLSNPVISSHGWLSYCVSDEDFNLLCEDLNEKDFVNVWESKQMNQIRKKYLSKRTLPQKCKRCLYAKTT